MKKFIIFLGFLALVAPVFAQNSSGDKPNMYYINVPVEKIFLSSEGYIIQYRNARAVVLAVGIPNEWFSEAGGRAQLLIMPTTSDYPTMSIFYIDNEFSHVRLYVHKAKSHHTWGSIPISTDVSSYFKDKEKFDIKF